MNQVYNNILEAERGGLLDLGKALRWLVQFGGFGGYIEAASVIDVKEGTVENEYISPAALFAANAAYTLTDTDNVTVNMNNGINFLLTITADRHIPNPSNVKIGQDGLIVIQQDGVGGHSLTWGEDWKFMGGAPTLPQSPHAWTLIRYFVQAPTVIRTTTEATGGTALNVATVEDIWAGLETLRYISPSALIDSEVYVELIDGDPVFIDFGDGKNFQLTLTGNRTIDTPLDQMPGRNGILKVKQDNIGGHNLTWNGDWKFRDGVPTLRLEPNAETIFRYRVASVGEVEIEKESVSATVNDYFSGESTDKYLSPKAIVDGFGAIVIEDGPTPTADFKKGLIFSLTLGGDRVMQNPINQKKQAGLFYIRQDNVGNHTLSWNSNFQFVGGVTPTIPTAPDAWTVIPYQVLSPGTILCVAVEAPVSTGGTGSGAQAASTAETKAGLIDTKYVSPTALSGFFSPVILTDGPTITPDLSAGSTFIVTLGGNRVIANIANQRPGRSGEFIIVQDGTGNRTLTWGNNYAFVNGTPILPTSPSSWTMVSYLIQDHGVIRCKSIEINAMVGAATVSEVRAGTVTNKYISPSVALAANAYVSLVDAPIININLQSGINFEIILQGNRAIANPTNQIAGQGGLIVIQQDATGGRTLSWGNAYVFETEPPTLPADPGKHIVIPYSVRSSGRIFMGN